MLSIWLVFQYRKRYEVTCDLVMNAMGETDIAFQYRKRYEVTCDLDFHVEREGGRVVSIPQAV